MKKFILKTFTLLLFSVTLLSCEKNDSINGADNEKANYYVKYEAKSSPQYIQYITVNTDMGSSQIQGPTRSWTETYGPVSKGFRASINANVGYATTKIYVSKNQEPFSLKSTGTSSTSYTIDF